MTGLAFRSMMWAFIAYTIPKNRSQATSVRERMLETREATEMLNRELKCIIAQLQNPIKDPTLEALS